MRAHLLDDEGYIINTVLVPDLDFCPNLVDAAIGGQIGDRILDGELVYIVTEPPVDEPETTEA